MEILKFKPEEPYDLPKIAVVPVDNQPLHAQTAKSLQRQITIRYECLNEVGVVSLDFLKTLENMPFEWILFVDNQVFEREFIFVLQRNIQQKRVKDAVFFTHVCKEDGKFHKYIPVPQAINQLHDTSIFKTFAIKKSVLMSILQRVESQQVCYEELIAGINTIGAAVSLLDANLAVTPTFCTALKSKNKRILALTHELSLTGAPIVLLETLKVLKRNGYDVLLMSPTDGPLAHTCFVEGVPTVVDETLYQYTKEQFEYYAHNGYTVIASTVCLAWCIKSLMQVQMPVMWWIHDANGGYAFYKTILPETLTNNIHLYAGGEHAKNIMLRYRPDYQIQNLIYGIQSRQISDETIAFDLPVGEKTLFSTIGTIEHRKGQDVLCDVIEKLPTQIVSKCLFFFAGGSVDEEIYCKVKSLALRFPQNVYHVDSIPREAIDDVYQQSDCMICASRDDPMPVFIAEGMLFKTPAICSTNTGTAPFIAQGKAGFVYENNDESALAQAIIAFLELPHEEREQLSRNAEKLFFENFDMKVFERNILDVMKEVQDET